MADRPSLPQLDPDPDRRSLRWGWALWAVGCAGAALHLSIAGLAAVSALTLVPAAALLLLWPLWRLGRHAWHAVSAAGQDAWHGAYFEFDGLQLRVFEDEDRLWFAVDDVLDALGLAGRARDPARLRLLAGRDGVRPAPGTRLPCFTERGLRAWLERRTEPRAAVFARWLEAQVLRPHRRRREMLRGPEPTQAAADAAGHTAARRP